MPIRDRKPRERAGYRYVYREGCVCERCPWKGKCQGADWPHWIEIPDGGALARTAALNAAVGQFDSAPSTKSQ